MAGMSAPDEIVPDGKDWTVVLQEGCAECGFAPDDPAVAATGTGDWLRTTIPRWEAVLARPSVELRDRPDRWSDLEYSCHARDVCRVFLSRLELMLTSDDARFDDWDQDAAAVAGRYAEQDPAIVAREYDEAARALADRFDTVQGDDWQRPGLRSNGARFAVETFALYLHHDIEHHLLDVAG